MDVAHQLDREWSLLARTKVAKALPAWQQQRPQLRRFHSPDQLLRFLHREPAEQTDGPLLALLTLARHEQLARRTLLQVLLPALKTQAGRMVYPAQLRDEVWEVLLYVAWETICRYPLDQRHLGVATKLVLDVLHDSTRQLRQQAISHGTPEQTAEPLAADTDRDPEAAADRDATRERPAAAATLPPEAVLLEAIAADVLSRSEAELILLTRVDGLRLPLLARTLGVSYHALRQRRQRAEQRLRTFLTSKDDVSKTSASTLVFYGEEVSRLDHSPVAACVPVELRAERAA